MQIGNLPIHSSSHLASRAQQTGREESASLQPAATRKSQKAVAPPGRLDDRPNPLNRGGLNPAFAPGPSHSGQHAVNTYRSIADDAGPELLNRLDVSA